MVGRLLGVPLHSHANDWRLRMHHAGTKRFGFHMHLASSTLLTHLNSDKRETHVTGFCLFIQIVFID